MGTEIGIKVRQNMKPFAGYFRKSEVELKHYVFLAQKDIARLNTFRMKGVKSAETVVR